MISFIWPVGEPMLAGTGGSETFTAGHARELLRRGIQTQIVTVGHKLSGGKKDFPDIPFLELEAESQFSDLPGSIVFVNKPTPLPTKSQAAVILHNVTPEADKRQDYIDRIGDKTIIVTSVYSGQQWALYLKVPYSRMHVVLPFADPIFGAIKRSAATKKIRILYAGRLHPEKGIYTVLEAMHLLHEDKTNSVSIVLAGQHVESGRVINRMLKDYPYARLLPPRKSAQSMAQTLAASDILLMPSVYAEPFGMLSIEAQQAGCRVVASNIGGLPETNSGLLTLVEPHNAIALLNGIGIAKALGAAAKRERETAKKSFTLKSSVDSLLLALNL